MAARMRSTMRLLACALFLLPLIACGGPPAPNLDSSGTTIVCLGDSITAGIGAGSAPTYPELLGDLLGGVEVINEGVPGDTSADGLERLDDVLAHDPWLVIVELGGNDLLRRVPVAETERTLRQIVEGLLEADIAPMLVEVHGPLGGAHEAMFERLADDYDLPLVEDTLPEILGDRALKSDAIHPNGEGYERLAEAVAEAVAPLVEARRELR